MPRYDFACRDCGQSFEKKLRMSQAGDPQSCPDCGSGDTRRQISAAFAVSGSRQRQAAPAPPPSSPFT